MPLSATVVTRALLSDQGARVLSDVVKNDASIGEDYAPVGYYGDFQIRGFPIDLATGLQINGMTIAGEQDVPLENKESVEFVKGIAGIESGVASAGGLIDYVTKQPAMIEAMDMATDHRGSSYGAVDLGHLFGSRKQGGARVNLAGEEMQSYVNDANGWRAMGAGAADWKIGTEGDFERRLRVSAQGAALGLRLSIAGRYDGARSDPGLPLDDVGRAVMGQAEYLRHVQHRRAVGLRSAAILAGLCPGQFQPFADRRQRGVCVWDTKRCSASPSYFFAPDGTYDIYDYRNPGELRIDAQAEALVAGHWKTGAIVHDLAGGGVCLRSVQQPSNALACRCTTGWARRTSINPFKPFPMESPLDSAGPRVLDEDNHQSAVVLQDRMRLPGRIQLLAGGREDSVRDHNYSWRKLSTNRTIWLPQYAATFNPADNLTLYGNYSVMLSLGPQAPWWSDNSAAFLDPYLTRQAEVGAKYTPGHRILLSTALFRMKTPFLYPKILAAPDQVCTYNYAFGQAFAAGDQCFESEGHEMHDGIELNAEGKATSWMQLTALAAAIRAISDQTGTPAFDNKQVINVPHLHTALFADILLPHARGLHLMPGWSYTGRKEATRDDAVSVSGYNIFNLGARYTPGGEQGHMTLRVYADNILDKRYWKDTGANYGDTFIHLGAPTTVRLSAHYTF